MEYGYRYDTYESELEYSTTNHKNLLDKTKQIDKGYNKLYRKIQQSDGSSKTITIDTYTTGEIGSNIRDAETGAFYPEKVGSFDEDLFFKVVLATSDCNSRNGSSTLFYISPRHYMSHMNCDVDQTTITNWEIKRDDRLREKEKNGKTRRTPIN
jgi:hypothetical protein